LLLPAWLTMLAMKRPTPETTGPSYVLLGEVAERFAAARLTMLEVSCNCCDRRGRLSIGRLLAEHGPELPGPELRRIIAHDCPRRVAGKIPDVCGVHFPRKVALTR
jgi:hypothetical protein